MSKITQSCNDLVETNFPTYLQTNASVQKYFSPFGLNEARFNYKYVSLIKSNEDETRL